jgi:Fic family protein
MQIPQRAPKLTGDDLQKLVELVGDFGRRQATGSGPWPPAPDEYLHWDKLRHLDPPSGFTAELWWHALRIGRHSARRHLDRFKDEKGMRFGISLVDPIPEQLHRIDRNAGVRVETPEPILNDATRDRYLYSSLIEEAFSSSQIEGAVTTRKAAKEMIRDGRQPKTESEQMVLNGYRTMERIREFKDDALTPGLILEIHRRMTEKTLDNPEDGGRLRTQSDDVRVEDEEGNIVHIPPKAAVLPERLRALCDFANGVEERGFLHPILRAIVLHFWLAYDHPFVDGNGRCARALFYWSMLHQGYWLTEFLSISQAIQRSRQQYYRSFLYTETDDNDLTYFILYHLKVIRQAIDRLFHYLKKQATEVEELESRLRAIAVLNHRQRALLVHALKHQGQAYSIEGHRSSHGVVYQTARADLLDLVRRGLLEQRKRGRALVFFAVPRLRRRLEGTASTRRR